MFVLVVMVRGKILMQVLIDTCLFRLFDGGSAAVYFVKMIVPVSDVIIPIANVELAIADMKLHVVEVKLRITDVKRRITDVMRYIADVDFQ
jgi:hypothetical protein